jgi:hypothetical protein
MSLEHRKETTDQRDLTNVILVYIEFNTKSAFIPTKQDFPTLLLDQPQDRVMHLKRLVGLGSSEKYGRVDIQSTYLAAVYLRRKSAIHEGLLESSG